MILPLYSTPSFPLPPFYSSPFPPRSLQFYSYISIPYNTTQCLDPFSNERRGVLVRGGWMVVQGPRDGEAGTSFVGGVEIGEGSGIEWSGARYVAVGNKMFDFLSVCLHPKSRFSLSPWKTRTSL